MLGDLAIEVTKMRSFKFPRLLLCLWLIALLSLTSSTESAPTYSAHYCFNTTLFTANSTYQTNLNLVLSSLSSNSTDNNGFHNASAGGNTPDEDVVSGLFLCRGDVNTTVCQDCVATARQDLLRRCPLNKAAIIWYDECLLRYSNQSILATINEVPGFDLPGSQNIAEAESDRFNAVLASAMNSLATKASNSDSGKKFATEEDEVTSSEKLYSLGQCTPDLTVSDCYRCFRSAIGALPMCCNGKQGGRVLLPSCNIRYEVYPFYNITSASPILPPLAPPGEKKLSSVIIVAIVIPIAVSVVLLFIGCCFFCRRARKKYNTLPEENGGVEITNVESLQFDLDIIEAATNKFSEDNKIGEGGFGAVYMGTLPNGQHIAVKRLSVRSGQGAVEFKNEVVLVAKLQHRNLVRLLGFCLGGEEKILVYEYVPNKSLDYFLFEPSKQGELDWSKRYKIIEGIARGILYLHEDSRLRIIHRDVKASNVLLDDDMNPKISDFGMARIFVVDQTQANTNRIVGTFGYMSPEYAMHGRYSVKSDVFSFGVLVLEIISGKKNTHFYQSELAEDLLSYAWKQWRNGTPLELLDPALRNSYSRNEVIRCIHMGLLCVQENPANRPTMATIALMLNSYSVTLPLPQQPAFLHRSRAKLNKPITEVESDQHTNQSNGWSVNEASFTEIYPR
ncbi:cysteine-rich receptor-like protein kinase 25 isoform X1 [Castanea sativa]|uniref:cysteine-rich receptor-like protein kinase 25 isoform X1 n=1 Tax=Castanea sativa TaxID=21020 RepID=UPI003F64BCE8